MKNPTRVRVFVADEQPIVRHGISIMLQRESEIEVVGETSDGWDAVERAQELKPDIVVVDFSDPNLAGIEAPKFISLVAERIPEVSFLIVTSCQRTEFLSDTLESGAKGYLLKSVEWEELGKVVRMVYLGGTFICPAMQAKLVGDYVKRGQREPGDDSYYSLTGREREVLPMLANALTNRQIAEKLYVSPNTVQTYRQRIMKKLDLHNGIDILKYALCKGIVSLDEG